jgi:AcrR family transcriptional regulator
MNQAPDDTPAALVAAARALFARHGYAGASIRAITREAHANLGAVTYHFGTKARLYEAVLESVTDPLRERVRAAADGAPTPVEGILAVVRAFFDHLAIHPDMPALLLHDLALDRAVPAPVRRTMEDVSGTVARLVASGQRDHSIVAGQPLLLTVSLVAQPVYFALVRSRLRSIFDIDTGDSAVRDRVRQHILDFVRRGLAPNGRTEP